MRGRSKMVDFQTSEKHLNMTSCLIFFKDCSGCEQRHTHTHRVSVRAPDRRNSESVLQASHPALILGMHWMWGSGIIDLGWGDMKERGREKGWKADNDDGHTSRRWNPRSGVCWNMPESSLLGVSLMSQPGGGVWLIIGLLKPWCGPRRVMWEAFETLRPARSNVPADTELRRCTCVWTHGPSVRTEASIW